MSDPFDEYDDDIVAEQVMDPMEIISRGEFKSNSDEPPTPPPSPVDELPSVSDAEDKYSKAYKGSKDPALKEESTWESIGNHLDALGTSAIDSALFGNRDRVIEGVAGFVGGERGRKNAQRETNAMRENEVAHPISRTVGNLAGFIGNPVGGAIVKGGAKLAGKVLPKVLPKAVKNLVGGAAGATVDGTLHNIGNAKGDLESRIAQAQAQVPETALWALGGTALGQALSGTAQAAPKIGKKMKDFANIQRVRQILTDLPEHGKKEALKLIPGIDDAEKAAKFVEIFEKYVPENADKAAKFARKMGVSKFGLKSAGKLGKHFEDAAEPMARRREEIHDAAQAAGAKGDLGPVHEGLVDDAANLEWIGQKDWAKKEFRFRDTVGERLQQTSPQKAAFDSMLRGGKNLPPPPRVPKVDTTGLDDVANYNAYARRSEKALAKRAKADLGKADTVTPELAPTMPPPLPRSQWDKVPIKVDQDIRATVPPRLRKAKQAKVKEPAPAEDAAPLFDELVPQDGAPLDLVDGLRGTAQQMIGERLKEGGPKEVIAMSQRAADGLRDVVEGSINQKLPGQGTEFRKLGEPLSQILATLTDGEARMAKRLNRQVLTKLDLFSGIYSPAGLVASKIIGGRESATLASGAEMIAKALARKTPPGRAGKAMLLAAKRGPSALSAQHFMLYSSDPEYQKYWKEQQEKKAKGD